jgi:hypothetical protein
MGYIEGNIGGSMTETKVGRITHYFPKVGVAMVEVLEGELSVGDKIHIKGHKTDCTQVVQSMQIERQPAVKLDKGQIAGLKTDIRVHEDDEVFRVTE